MIGTTTRVRSPGSGTPATATSVASSVATTAPRGAVRIAAGSVAMTGGTRNVVVGDAVTTAMTAGSGVGTIVMSSGARIVASSVVTTVVSGVGRTAASDVRTMAASAAGADTVTTAPAPSTTGRVVSATTAATTPMTPWRTR